MELQSAEKDRGRAMEMQSIEKDIKGVFDGTAISLKNNKGVCDGTAFS